MYLTPPQLDALQELMNIGIGRAAGSLNQLFDRPVRVNIPSIRLGKAQDFVQDPLSLDPSAYSSVGLPFHGRFSGSASLLFPRDSAASLVSLVIGEAQNLDTMDTLREATLTEIGNIVLNGVMGSFANVLEEKITYDVPCYQQTSDPELFQTASSHSEDPMLWAQTQFTIEVDDISEDIMLMLAIPDFGLLLTTLDKLLDPKCA